MKITEDRWNWKRTSNPCSLVATNGYDTVKVLCWKSKPSESVLYYSITVNDGLTVRDHIPAARGQERTALLALLKQLLDEPRKAPMTLIEMVEQIAMEKSEGYIHGIVGIELNDIIRNDIDGFDDIISERLTGTADLVDMDWHMVGFSGETVYFRISGDARELLGESGAGGEVWQALIAGLGKCEADGKRGYWTNGEEILCKTEKEANDLADFLEKSLGFESVNTSYYDPEEDRRDGTVDENTGYWAVY